MVLAGDVVRARVASLMNGRLDEATLEARWLRAELYEARNPYRVILPYTQDGLLYRWTGEKYEPFPIDFEGWWAAVAKVDDGGEG